MKKEYIILLAVIVALSGYLFTRNTSGTHYELPELATVAAGDVDRMEIKAGEETLLFEKRGEEWTVDTEGFPAKQDEVDKLVKTIGELSLTALVSEAESYSRYDLGPDKAKTVTIFKGDAKVRECTIGKAAPSWQHTFVMVEGGKKVYHAKGNFSSQFTTDDERFMNKKVLAFNAAEVTSLAVTKGEKSLNLARTTEEAEESGDPQTAWKDEDGNTLEKDKVEKIISSLSNLRCDKWMVEKPGGSTASLTLTVTTDRPYTLDLFGKSPMLGTVSDKTFAFVFSDSTGNNLVNHINELLGDTIPEKTPATTE